MKKIPQDQPRYTRVLAVEMAGVSVEFLERCESERLIETRTISASEPEYSVRDIRQLVLLHRLHEILGIDFQDLEVVMHLRTQLLDLQRQMSEMERQRIEREELLLSELAELRRQLADRGDWS